MADANSFFTWALWSGVAIGIGATIAAWLARRTKISEFRQEWINELRKDIAEYIGMAEKWIRKWDELNSVDGAERSKRVEVEAFPISNEARVILYRIQLRFNPRENRFKSYDDAFVKSLEDLLDPRALLPDQFDASWRDLAMKSVNLGRELLKREWEVTKEWPKPWRNAPKRELAPNFKIAFAVICGIFVGIFIGAFFILQMAKIWPSIWDLPSMHMPNILRIGQAENGQMALCGLDGYAYQLESSTVAESPFRSFQGVRPMKKFLSTERDQLGVEISRPSVAMACRPAQEVGTK